MTLLSPARDITVAKAAIQAGADAVYIGAPRFGARQAAGNSLDDLQALVHYAHTYGVQVLVTLNTLLREEEYAEAVEMAWALYHIGIDALIIQDLRLLTFRLPPIRLHASTQCDNRTAEQVIRLQDMGFRRVVLARELSISEIRAIRDAVLAHSEAQGQQPIELEAFVHGALCVSYSGRCYMSEVLTGRSANRGACSQMCRMRYDLLDADMQELTDDQGRPIHQRYLLSLQDMDRSAHLQELIDAGVTTFKIEGRLKDADYVTNITAYYRLKLDQITNAAQGGAVS
ncbi:MAG: peptidase U32 family protein, partial [Paludibacteraceae bacterium]